MLNHLFWTVTPTIIAIDFSYLGFSEHHAVTIAAGHRQTTYIWKKSYSALRQRLLSGDDTEHNTPEGTGGSIWLLTCSSSESFQQLSCCAGEFMIRFQKTQHSLMKPAIFF